MVGNNLPAGFNTQQEGAGFIKSERWFVIDQNEDERGDDQREIK